MRTNVPQKIIPIFEIPKTKFEFFRLSFLSDFYVRNIFYLFKKISKSSKLPTYTYFIYLFVVHTIHRVKTLAIIVCL